MRTFALVGVAILGLIAAGVSAGQETPKAQFSVQRVAANVYMLRDSIGGDTPSGNVAVLVGSDGLLLVDAGWDDAEAIFAALKTISDRPVRYVVDTHCHTDHAGGNAAFQSVGATVVASETLRRRLAVHKCDNEVAQPTVTFDEELNLYFAGEEVRIVKLPTGHTDGDAIVYFATANVVATGDAFVASPDGVPAYSKYAGGNMLGVNEQLRKIVELLPGDVKIIPGHGPQSAMNDVRTMLEALDYMRDAVAEQVATGKTKEQVESFDLPPPWNALIPSEDRRLRLRFYYDCLTGPPDPKFQL